MEKLVNKLKCFFGFHKNFKWKPYPNVAPKIEVARCKHCDDYEWR